MFNDALHDSYHLESGTFKQTVTFKRLQQFHFVHHRNMKKNFGIVTTVWDRIFNSIQAKR